MTKQTYFMAVRKSQPLLADHHCDQNGLRYFLMATHRWDETHWLLHQRNLIPDTEQEKVALALKRLLNHEPPQYVAGLAPFYGRWFRVNPDVLIPEDETVDLVDWAFDQLPADRPLRVLDLGTGSGCIGITVALERPRWSVVASDISKSALKVARANAKHLDASVDFVASDLFARLAGMRFDAVITNPPYVAKGETAVMDRAVLDYEPHLALFAGTDGLDFYRRLFAELPAHLTAGGQLFGETGFRQEETIVKEFNRLLPGATIQTRHDAAGKMRMIHGCDFSDVGGK